MRTADEVADAASDGRRKEIPRQEGREEKSRVGHVPARDLEEAAEYGGQDDEGEQRLEPDPGHAQEGLAIADLDVTPGEKEEELPVPPHFSNTPERSGTTRRDHDERVG